MELKARMGLQSLSNVQEAFIPLYKLKNIYFKDLGKIRHGAFAHRDIDSLQQLNMIESIDSIDIYLVGENAFNILATILSAMVDALENIPDR